MINKFITLCCLKKKKEEERRKKKLLVSVEKVVLLLVTNIIEYEQNFYINWFSGNFFQPVFKSAMCLLTCKKYTFILIAYASHMHF
jgi:hypothetical protein